MRMLPWFFCLALAGSAAGAELRFDFAGTPAGAMPTNFSSVVCGTGRPGAWQIVMDAVPSAFGAFPGQVPNLTRQAVLAQTSQSDLADEHFPICVYDGEIFRDFNFTTRFKIVSGIAEQMAGVVFRFQNASNFYVARVSALGKNLRFYKVVNGLRSDPIGPDLDIAAGAWHALGVKCDGNQIAISLDGKPAMPPLQDNTFRDGKLGFWTMSDAVSYFADAAVTYTPRIPAAQKLVDSVLSQEPRILDLRIYTLETNNTTRVLAGKNPADLRQPGGEAELKAVRDGTVWFGRERDAVVVTLPLHDRNGDFIAAVRVKLKSFFGETQDTAVTRATMILKMMQAQCLSAEDLLK